MFTFLRLISLLFAYYLLSLTAEDVEVTNEYAHCKIGTRMLSNVQNLGQDCYAALRLAPNPGIELDPHEMERNRFAPGPDKPISLRLVGNKTHRIDGDLVRLPAAFMSGNCIIVVNTNIMDKPENQALFNHMYCWKEVRRQVISSIRSCLNGQPVPEERAHQNWMLIAEFKSKFHLGQRTLSDSSTELRVRPIRRNPVSTEDPNNPDFTKEESREFQLYNIYNSTGLIHSNRWETTFKRPTAPLIVQIDNVHCKTGHYKLLNIDHIRNECNAALRLVPKSNLKIDPQDIPTTRLETDPEQLWGTENPTSSDRSRLPALYMTENCLIEVESLHHLGRRYPAPFNEISRWPSVSKLAEGIINECLRPQILKDRKGYWSQIGENDVYYFMENQDGPWLSIIVYVRTLKQPAIKGNSKNPHFTDDELEYFKDYNIYTPTGQIHDIRWGTPFQRPQLTGNKRRLGQG
jgi:hypothetical protein